VQWVEISASTLQTREFSGIFADWQKRVADYHQNTATGRPTQQRVIDPDKLTVSQIVGALKPAQIWGIIGAIAAALTAIAVTADKLGEMTPSAKKTAYALSAVVASRQTSINAAVNDEFDR
jgi:hypothetical protein